MGDSMAEIGPLGLVVDSGAGSAETKKQASLSNNQKLGVGGCLPKAPTIPAIYIRSEKVRGTIELWKEKALIRKFVGIWPKEKDLVKWISSVWNPKGHYDL